MFAEEVHVAFLERGTSVKSNFGIIIVDPVGGVILLTCVTHIMTSVDACTEVCNEALKLEVAIAFVCFAVSESRLNSCHRVNLHALIII